MDHSIQGYISRLTNKQLEDFLLSLLETKTWESYENVIPEIMRQFQRRGYIPHQTILDAWHRMQ